MNISVEITAGGLVRLEKPTESVYMVLIAEWLFTGKLGSWMNFISLNEEIFNFSWDINKYFENIFERMSILLF